MTQEFLQDSQGGGPKGAFAHERLKNSLGVRAGDPDLPPGCADPGSDDEAMDREAPPEP